jgi:hypothetical protein
MLLVGEQGTVFYWIYADIFLSYFSFYAFATGFIVKIMFITGYVLIDPNRKEWAQVIYIKHLTLYCHMAFYLSYNFTVSVRFWQQ